MTNKTGEMTPGRLGGTARRRCACCLPAAAAAAPYPRLYRVAPHRQHCSEKPACAYTLQNHNRSFLRCMQKRMREGANIAKIRVQRQHAVRQHVTPCLP